MYPINSLKVGIFLQKSNSGFQTLGGFPIPKHGSSTPPPPPGFRRRILFATCTDADFDFKLHVLPPRIFKRSGSSADAEIVEGVRPNQEPLSLSAGFFSFLDKWSYFFFIWAGCFSFSLSKDSFSVDFSIGVSVKSFHATTEFLSCIKFVMIYWIKICKSHEIRAMMSFCREHFPRSLARWQDYDTFIVY